MVIAAAPTAPAFLLAWAIATTAGVLVFLHANKRGSKHATAWGIGVFAVLAVVLPVYVVHARRHRGTPGRRY